MELHGLMGWGEVEQGKWSHCECLNVQVCVCARGGEGRGAKRYVQVTHLSSGAGVRVQLCML